MIFIIRIVQYAIKILFVDFIGAKQRIIGKKLDQWIRNLSHKNVSQSKTSELFISKAKITVVNN